MKMKEIGMIALLAVFAGYFAGCRFAMKDFNSSIGEITAETKEMK